MDVVDFTRYSGAGNDEQMSGLYNSSGSVNTHKEHNID
jgi:hypothetical protein